MSNKTIQLTDGTDSLFPTVNSDTIVVDTVRSQTFSISASGIKEITFSVTKTGYTPIGIAGWNIQNVLASLNAVLIRNGECTLVVTSHSSSAVSNAYVDMDIFYLKNI